MQIFFMLFDENLEQDRNPDSGSCSSIFTTKVTSLRPVRTRPPHTTAHCRRLPASWMISFFVDRHQNITCLVFPSRKTTHIKQSDVVSWRVKTRVVDYERF
jgi:hypothetical protein